MPFSVLCLMGASITMCGILSIRFTCLLLWLSADGLLIGRRNQIGGGYFDTLRRRFNQLIVPFLMWSLLSMIASWNVSVGGFIKTILYPDTSFWFLWVLFWINVLFMSGRWVASMLNVDELLPNVAICLVLLGIMVSVEFRMFGFQFLAYYYVFYLFGYCLHRYSAFRLKSVWVGMALMAVWAILAWFWNMHQLPCWLQGMPYVPKALLQYAYRGATAMIAVFVILSYSERLLGGSGMINMTLRWVGTVSLGLYVCHLTIIGKLNDLLQRLCYLGCEANVIVLFVVALFASIAIVGLLSKGKLASRLFLGKF